MVKTEEITKSREKALAVTTGSRLLSLTPGPELRISRREERQTRPGGEVSSRGYGECRPGGCLGEMRWSLQTTHSPGLMEEVEISQVWLTTLLLTGHGRGKSDRRLPSEYHYGII